MKTNRIPELDGLRAFAVLSVTVFHMWDNSGLIPKGNFWLDFIIPCFGPAGVSVFFVISGFIITSLLLRENSYNGGVSLKKFYIRRFFRIIPPYAIYLLTIFFLYQIDYISINPINFLWSGLFLTDLNVLVNSGGDGPWFFNHTWSLSVEEQYYLFFPYIMVLLKFRLRPINLLLIGFFCFSLLSIIISHELSPIHKIFTKLVVFYKFRYIIIGVIIAIHRKSIFDVIEGKSILFPVFMMCVMQGVFFANTFFVTLSPLQSMLISPLLSGIETIACGFLVIWFVANPAKCGILRLPVVQWLGLCSYSIYLWQQLFTQSPKLYHGWTIVNSPLCIVAILFCASLSFYFIEKPTIRLGHYFSARKEKADLMYPIAYPNNNKLDI